MATEDAVREALATVNDPEIQRPITELGMVKSVEIGADGAVAVTVYLTVTGCPSRVKRLTSAPLHKSSRWRVAAIAAKRGARPSSLRAILASEKR